MPAFHHRLDTVTEIRPGFLARKAVPDDAAGTHRLLQLRDFSHDRTALNLSSAVRFTPRTRSAPRALRAGDVLFLAKGASPFAYCVEFFDCQVVAAGYFFVLTPRANIHPAYLSWFLNHESTHRMLSRKATTGTSMPVVTRAVLEDLRIPLPPLASQIAVAELDALRIREAHLQAKLVARQHALVSAVCLRTAREGILPSPPTNEGTRP